MDYLVVSWVVAEMVEEEAFLEIFSEDSLTLSELERCSASPDKRSQESLWAQLQDLNSRLGLSSMAGRRGLA